jgi:hypothetical protein
MIREVCSSISILKVLYDGINNKKKDKEEKNVCVYF